MKPSLKLTAGLVALSAAFAPTAMAADDIKTGDVIATGTSGLSLSLPTAVSLGVIVPGQATTFSPVSIATITPDGSWSMSVKDETATPGVLKKDTAAANPACASGAANLGSALSFSADPLVDTAVTTTGELGSAAATLVAAGTSLSDTVNVTFTQPELGDTVQIAAGCTYRTTATYTLTG